MFSSRLSTNRYRYQIHRQQKLTLGVVALLMVCLSCIRLPGSPPDKGLAREDTSSIQGQSTKLGASPLRVPAKLLAFPTPSQISELTHSAQATCDRALAAIVSQPNPTRTFINTVEAMEQAIGDYIDTMQRILVLADIHPDKKIRQAAAVAAKVSQTYLVEVSSRGDLYRAILGWQTNAGKKEVLDSPQKRLLELTMREFRRNGLELSDSDRERLVAIRQQLNELSAQFIQNIKNNKDSIEVNPSDLQGVPASFMQRMKKSPSEKYVITVQPQDFFLVMEYAKNEDLRRQLYIAFQCRESSKNIPILTEVIKLRDEEAKLLGYAHHADFVTKELMAGSSQTVTKFLFLLQEKLRPKRDQNFAEMLALKRKQTGNAQCKLYPWDVLYYLNEIKKRSFTLSSEKINEYFPAPTVIAAMFKTFGDLFGFEVVEIPNPKVWSQEVKLYEIRDQNTKNHWGAFYMDLYPREGKYANAGCATIGLAREVEGIYQAPISLLLTNFDPPSGDRPALLSHENVRELFHEFGHILHKTLTTARYSTLSGSNVASDFVEIPSQIMENWAYEQEVLQAISGHYLDPHKKLPNDVINKILEARTFDVGVRYTKQVFLASFDQKIHTEPQPNAKLIEHQLFSDIMDLPAVPESCLAANFGHLMEGYGASYYGYVWAEVLADDIFALFQKDGILNSELGHRYRQTILAKGGSIEANALLKQFLGRSPSDQAFFRKLGLESK